MGTRSGSSYHFASLFDRLTKNSRLGLMLPRLTYDNYNDRKRTPMRVQSGQIGHPQFTINVSWGAQEIVVCHGPEHALL